ncbi:Rieske (2Fe-2S) protein [Streptomyces sp. RKND-216]|uniref:Rieske (2Fe-2S) protein n=1 Tax=Streptomyces sp. RKND-216 TaxID=2562581 RepID=UPI00109D947D|nr:Rieske (2Fe-2S) protein [Streptomyces sp. RKND-216]THA23819.1 Rieske (2Fe-2S) protein [Streptomyces sp. RKND-216]
MTRTTERNGHRGVRALLEGAAPNRPRPGAVMRAVERLEHTEAYDDLVMSVRKVVRAVPSGPVRDVLHGRWLGHPVHPMSAQVPIGAWTSAAVLDVLGGGRRAARTLVGVGLLSAGPTALAGWADWAELKKPQLRVGLVHSVLNATAVALYTGSLAARLRGRESAGKALGFAGLTAVAAGGALGGHLAYRQGAGVNHADQVESRVGSDWHTVGRAAEIPVDEPVRCRLEDADTDVVVVRDADDRWYALAEQCCHLGGPLSEGDLVDGCVRCPWHGSTFRLTDGWNATGPATGTQPAFETRVESGLLEVRLRPPE